MSLPELPYTQDIDRCLAGADAKDGEHKGLSRAILDETLGRTAAGIAKLRLARDDGSLPLLRLPDSDADLGAIEARAAEIRARADHVLVLGTGGSSLGGQALYALADVGFGPAAGGCKLHFLDNIDPHTYAAFFEAVDLARVHVIAISKSGGTAETITQLMVVVAEMQAKLGRDAIAERLTIITEPADNVLRRLATEWGIPTFDHDPKIGGRYSVLSIVGLLPAACAGLDIRAVRAGAAKVLAATLRDGHPADAPPAVGAAINVGLWREHGIGTTVLMPYVDRLAWFGMWFRQLWAESLGKDGKGTTPVRALGTVDQHSQLQLYLGGPADKLFTLVFSEAAGTGGKVDPALAHDKALAYLAGRTMGDLLDAEQRATADSLTAHGRPTRILTLRRVDETGMGAMMMHYMLETMIAGHLLGVDPFDQPAVEDSKQRARAYLQRMAG